MLPLLDGILFCRNISGSSLRGYLAQELGQLAYLQELYALAFLFYLSPTPEGFFFFFFFLNLLRI